MKIASGKLWKTWPRQGNWNTAGQDRWVKTKNLGQDIWDQTTGTEKLRQFGLDKSAC
jgi:hypothetical protein